MPDQAPDHAPPEPATRLYLISPPEVGGDFPARLERALDAGAGLADAFQFRVKGLPGGPDGQHEAARLAEPLQAICADRDVAFIVNDSIALAARLGADGVHLGQGDGDLHEAREVLGPQAQIGSTCHASRHLAMEAGEAGADYVAFGPFFASSTKATEGREQPTVELIEWWAQIFEVPVVAIGGIAPDNCGSLVRAGADFLAVSGAVWNGDEVAAITAFRRAIEKAGNGS